MEKQFDYLQANKELWNARTEVHISSEFYQVDKFRQGWSSLNEIELELLGDINGKSILHLQCHFGQDSISLARKGAEVTGIDLSDKAIEYATHLAKELDAGCRFHCCNVYDVPLLKLGQFDIVFTSYGTIGWLPDLDKWAMIVAQHLKPGGRFVFAEFHPAVWMWDNDFKQVEYSYFKAEAIVETETGTYADTGAAINKVAITWNHSIAEVVTALLQHGLELNSLQEFDYSPYPIFPDNVEIAAGKYQIKKFGNKLPLVYSLVMQKGIKPLEQ